MSANSNHFDPLLLLTNERAEARAKGDAMANLACLATAHDGQAAARMLVLRDLDDGLAMFLSETSPKAAQLAFGARPEVLVYLPSLNVQYRLGVQLRAVPMDLLAMHWQKRPVMAKRIDWFYNHIAGQSTPMASRDALKQAVNAHASSAQSSLTEPPAGARGYYLDIERLERLHIHDADPPHDRRLYVCEAGVWREQVLVP